MSKQIYIDSNGNEIQVSGTVNSADMMPMSGNDSTKVSEAIGDLSTLTTTDKSSIVGAVNEVIKVNTISASAGSAVASGSIVACYQVGKVVQVYIVGSANSTWGGSSEILTGLPKPKNTDIRYPVLKTSAGTPYGTGTSYQVAINASGVLLPMYIPSGAIGNGDYFVISFAYIAE